MGLRLPPAPPPLDPFAIACDALTVLGPGVWSSATITLALDVGGASIEDVVTTLPGGRSAVAGNPEPYASLLGEMLAALAAPVRGRARRAIFTFTRAAGALVVGLEPVSPPVVQTFAGHAGYAALSPAVTAAIDQATPAIAMREEGWFDAIDADATPSFAPSGTILSIGGASVPAHLVGVHRARDGRLAWAWEIGGVAPATAAAMATLRDARGGVLATASPRVVHDSTAYLFAWLVALELGAVGVVPIWSTDDDGGDVVTFVAAMQRPRA